MSNYWVDIYNHRVHQFNPATVPTFDVGEVVGCRAEPIDSHQRSRPAFLDTSNGGHTDYNYEDNQADTRFNDKCDAAGRFWFGSIAAGPKGRLYRYDPNGSLHEETGRYPIGRSRREHLLS